MSKAIDSIKAAQLYQFAGQDIPWLQKHWAAKKPEHPFLIWEPFEGESQTWTYARFLEDTKRIAAGLHARGVKKGDKVLIHCENCPEAVLAWYGCAWLGAVGVTTNTRCIGDELTYFAEHAGAVGVITQPKFAAEISANVKGANWRVITDTNSGTPAEESTAGYEPFASLFGDAAQAPEREPEPMLPAGIQYTSGTTSRPKAVVHTHANALWAGRSNTDDLHLDGNNVYLTFLPFFHVNTQSWSLWTTLWSGGTAVLQPKFSGSRFWEMSLKHKATHASMIPFTIKAVASQEVPEHHYKAWLTGVVIPELEGWFKVKTFASWGMTETVIHATRSDLMQDNPRMSIGRPSPGYEIALINEETGEFCKPGEIGKIYIRGVRGIQLFLEYYKNPEAMAKSFDADGWFDTGDTASVGEGGHLFFADRDKDVLKVGGENVSARQVEETIMAVGGIDEVAVVARKHDMLDEVPAAFVIKHPMNPMSDEELKAKIFAHCDANLADFKRPRGVYIVEEMPRATLNKVAKNELRTQAEALPLDR